MTIVVSVWGAAVVPPAAAQGADGREFDGYDALTIILAMASSLLVALTIVPPIASILSSRKSDREGGNPVVRVLLSLYRPSLDWTTRHRIPLAVVMVLLLVGAGLLIPRLGTEFLPPLDEGAIAVNAVRLPSASLDASKRQAAVVEKRILESFPEVDTVVSKTGRPEIAEDPMGPEQNDILIMLKPQDEWR